MGKIKNLCHLVLEGGSKLKFTWVEDGQYKTREFDHISLKQGEDVSKLREHVEACAAEILNPKPAPKIPNPALKAPPRPKPPQQASDK